MIDVFGSNRSSRNANVRSFGENLSRTLNLHLSLSGQSSISLRSVSGLSELTSSVRQSLKYFVLLLDLDFCELLDCGQDLILSSDWTCQFSVV